MSGRVRGEEEEEEEEETHNFFEGRKQESRASEEI